MGPRLHVRTATMADADAVIAIVNGAYRGTPKGDGWTTESHLVVGDRIDRERLAPLIAPPESVVLVGELDGSIVACVHLMAQDEACCELGMFAVRVDAQAGGLGKALLAGAEAHARDAMGAQRMVMYVLSVRDELLAWYQRRGYATTGATVPFAPDGDQRLLKEGLVFVELAKRLRSSGPWRE